jgi:hypothetical protein
MQVVDEFQRGAGVRRILHGYFNEATLLASVDHDLFQVNPAHVLP